MSKPTIYNRVHAGTPPVQFTTGLYSQKKRKKKKRKRKRERGEKKKEKKREGCGI